MTRSPSGVLIVPKPAGVTSHDVVEQVRRLPIARGGKVGHAGTLDPFATGALLVLIGHATRFQRFFMALPKTYEATAQLGARSDTGDPTGRLAQSGGRADAAAVLAAAARLVGEIDQRVPLTSAVKVGGERLYLKARRGEQFETPVRRVSVMRLDVTDFDEQAQTGEIVVECSSGTYVRQLVADLGELCGAGAYCAALQRTAIGPFALEDADEDRLVPLVEALSFLPERALDADEERLARTGRAVEYGEQDGPDALGHENGEGAVASNVRLTAGGELVAVAEPRDGKLKPVTVIPTPPPGS